MQNSQNNYTLGKPRLFFAQGTFIPQNKRNHWRNLKVYSHVVPHLTENCECKFASAVAYVHLV